MTDIVLTRNQTAQVDSLDSDLAALRWQARPGKRTWYAYRTVDIAGKCINVAMHRVILSRMLGRELSDSEQVDHINGDGLDNRRSNLRLVDSRLNARNRRTRRDSSTGVRGVEQIGRKYRARINVAGKHIHLGVFETLDEAKDAYAQASRNYFGEYGGLLCDVDGVLYVYETVRSFAVLAQAMTDEPADRPETHDETAWKQEST